MDVDRIYLCQFRGGCHNLPITEYRFNKNMPDDVFCSLCGSSDIGDEFHFLFFCNHFLKQRKKYLKQYYYLRPNTYKMEELFNSKSVEILQNLARFCREIILFFKKK